MGGTRGQEGWGGGVLSVAIAVQEGLFTHTLQKATTPSSCSTQHREEWETENRDNRRQETHFTLVRRKETDRQTQTDRQTDRPETPDMQLHVTGEGCPGAVTGVRGEHTGLERTASSIRPVLQGLPSGPQQTSTYLLPSHRLKHLLKLDSKLLDIVEQDAGLSNKQVIR